MPARPARPRQPITSLHHDQRPDPRELFIAPEVDVEQQPGNGERPAEDVPGAYPAQGYRAQEERPRSPARSAYHQAAAAETWGSAPPAPAAQPAAPSQQDLIYRERVHERQRLELEQNGATGAMTMQERYPLLLHAIGLYDDKWKLASIRANQQRDRLEAYLTPRNKRLELKEAIQKNRYMVIIIDSMGNTHIREPRRRRLLRRIFDWLFGD